MTVKESRSQCHGLSDDQIFEFELKITLSSTQKTQNSLKLRITHKNFWIRNNATFFKNLGPKKWRYFGITLYMYYILVPLVYNHRSAQWSENECPTSPVRYRVFNLGVRPRCSNIRLPTQVPTFNLLSRLLTYSHVAFSYLNFFWINGITDAEKLTRSQGLLW